ncbi:DUF4817 domain-containing protein [Trichonephila clavata]|uniref:DUF4817 domain-containing protein n=1 Tax=Trichonephila clavata TaxID=2740835 RepID=A0A8X6K8F8_TRICU|nr:DUF4817 domain-containing protein [Trichonephila clavata]
MLRLFALFSFNITPGRNGLIVKASGMVSLPDRTLLVQLFCKNGESTVVCATLQRFNMVQKRPISLNGIRNFVRWFEETGSLQDCLRSGRSSLSGNRVHVQDSVMKDLRVSFGKDINGK